MDEEYIIPGNKIFDAYALESIIHNYIYDQTRRGEVERPKLTASQIIIILKEVSHDPRPYIKGLSDEQVKKIMKEVVEE